MLYNSLQTRKKKNKQGGVSVDCQPLACRQFVLHSEQLRTSWKGGGGWGSLSKLNKFEHVGGPFTGTPWTEWQTDTTENITSANPLAGGNEMYI